MRLWCSGSSRGRWGRVHSHVGPGTLVRQLTTPKTPPERTRIGQIQKYFLSGMHVSSPSWVLNLFCPDPVPALPLAWGTAGPLVLIGRCDSRPALSPCHVCLALFLEWDKAGRASCKLEQKWRLKCSANTCNVWMAYKVFVINVRLLPSCVFSKQTGRAYR